jgi:hypothetical protein
MRWTIRAVASLCLFASIGGAVEAQEAQVIQNPYAVGPTSNLAAPPSSSQPPAQLSTWQGVVRPSAWAESTATITDTAAPVVRTLPNDRLKALRLAVNVRSTAEAYRAADLPPSQDRTAARTSPQNIFAATKRDEAVKPATWIEDVPAPLTNSPQLLSEVTTAHQEATRLTRNPYRSMGPSPSRATAPASNAAGNPLR